MNVSISYQVADTKDSVNDAIAREIHEIETLTQTANTQREKLCAFIKENRDAIDIAEVSATLKANGYARQRISEILREYGIVRRAKSKSRAEASEKVDALLPKAEAALMKLVGNDEKLFRAVINRLFRK